MTDFERHQLDLRAAMRRETDLRWHLLPVVPMREPSAWERFAAFCGRVFKGARHG